MPFTTGTATDYYDLLDKLRLYLIAQGWTVNAWETGGVTDTAQLDLTAPGSLGGQQPKMSIKTEFDTGINGYAWKISAYPNFNPALSFGNQVNNSPIHYFCLWPNTIDYWFYVNDRRFIVVAKIGVYYLSMYAGFFLPYALPAEYPFPYFIGATYPSLKHYNYDNSGMRAFADPGQNSCSYMKRESLEWALFKNSHNADNAVDAYSAHDGPVIWPFRNPPVEDNTNAADEIAWSLFRKLRPLTNGKMPMWQCTILDSWDETIPGVLDGVFATGGFNRVPEQVVTVGADNYRLFINVNRSSPKHYFAIEEV